MTVAELAEAILVARGSVQDEPRRTALAMAVARACSEVERTMAEPRFLVRRDHGRVLVAVLKTWPAMRGDWATRPTSWPMKIRWCLRFACCNVSANLAPG